MNIHPGMKIEDQHGQIGFVREVAVDPQTGEPYVVIRAQDGQLSQIDVRALTIDDDILRLSGGLAGQNQAHLAATQRAMETQIIVPSHGELRAEAANLAPGAEIKVPVIAEEAVIRKRAVETGGVRIHKTVRERQERVEAPITREEVEVQRVPINQLVDGDQAPGIREAGDTTIIPVVEEVLVVEKRLVVKEEIHLIRRRVTETQHAEVVLREEHIEIEELGAADDRAAGR